MCLNSLKKDGSLHVSIPGDEIVAYYRMCVSDTNEELIQYLMVAESIGVHIQKYTVPNVLCTSLRT